LVKGRIVHTILERLFGLAGSERTIEAARTFIDEAKASELTAEVCADLGFNEALESLLNKDINYFP